MKDKDSSDKKTEKIMEKCSKCGAEMPIEKRPVPLFDNKFRQIVFYKCPACNVENKFILYKSQDLQDLILPSTNKPCNDPINEPDNTGSSGDDSDNDTELS